MAVEVEGSVCEWERFDFGLLGTWVRGGGTAFPGEFDFAGEFDGESEFADVGVELEFYVADVLFGHSELIMILRMIGWELLVN